MESRMLGRALARTEASNRGFMAVASGRVHPDATPMENTPIRPKPHPQSVCSLWPWYRRALRRQAKHLRKEPTAVLLPLIVQRTSGAYKRDERAPNNLRWWPRNSGSSRRLMNRRKSVKTPQSCFRWAKAVFVHPDRGLRLQGRGLVSRM